MDKKKSILPIIANTALLLLCAAFCAGIKLVFHACPKKPDGTFMSCHWAEQSVFAFSLALTAMAVLLLIVRNKKTKTGIALAMIPAAAVTALIPNVMIKLCMMENMRCHSTMRPAVIVFSVVIAAAAVFCAAVNNKNAGDKK